MRLTRRQFIQRSGAAGVGAAVAPAFIRDLRAASPNALQRHAAIGAAGVATSDIDRLTAAGNNVRLVAVADVDLHRLLEVDLEGRFPGIRIYQDYREMLDKERDLDSVNVSIPDHMHAPAAMTAMQRGLSVYVQKPMTYTVHEARVLTEFAARNSKIVTQMGIQNHQLQHHRLVVQLVHHGVIGKVKEVYSWSNRRWGDTAPRPNRTDPVPKDLAWDLWLGGSRERPYIGDKYFHPGAWRKRIDYGTGTFGDMGCHILDPVFTALALTCPTSVRSDGPAPNDENWQPEAVVQMKFPGTAYTERELAFFWQHNFSQRPKAVVELLAGQTPHTEGSLYVGAKGMIYSPYGKPPQLLPETNFKDFALPEVGKGPEHHAEFAAAVQGRGTTSAPFSYSGPLTETVLLGCLSTRFPNTTLAWDAAKMKFTNESAANAFVRKTYRKGWEVPGLA